MLLSMVLLLKNNKPGTIFSGLFGFYLYAISV
jgi:hypothetical protein